MTDATTTIEHFLKVRPVKPCAVARLLTSIPDELARVAAQALNGDERKFPTNRWVSVLAHRGHFVSHSSATKHRRRVCSCVSSAR
jgi:hypothetical protein